MASTPPLRIISVYEPPPTPRHGPAYDDFEPRYSTRSSQRTTSREVKTTPEPQSGSRALRSAATPESKRLTAQQLRHNLSPPISPQSSPKHNFATRAQVLSPDSPGTRTRSHDTSSSNRSFTSSSKQQSLLSTSTVMADGMLPTPVKTPRKKAVSNTNAAARALFQEQPHGTDEIMPTPKKSRRSKRYTGFTLQSFTTDDGLGTGPVQIFTDSRDNVPEIDLSEANPFVDHPPKESETSVGRVGRSSKRRKLGAGQKGDPQVDEAIKNGEGMVYVFRGRKVYKRFGDGLEEEETTVDPDDLGLLEHTVASAEAVKLLKPVTRSSIKPTRLFQTEEQKQIREAEKAEEEVTDIEEEPSTDIAASAVPAPVLSTTGRQTRRTTAMKNVHTPDGHAIGASNDDEADVVGGGVSPAMGKVKASKRSSPFDSWKRVKSGASALTTGTGKGRKRASSTLEEGEQATVGKKLRNR